MFSTAFAGKAALTALRFVLSLGQGLFKHQKADSLVSFTQSTRVEPIALIDQRALQLPYVGDVMQSLNSLFIGYYLQAVSLLVNVGRIDVVKLLDAVSPTRDAWGAVGNVMSVESHGGMLSLESYQHSLPIPFQTASLEDIESTSTKEGMASVGAQTLGTLTGAKGMQNLEKGAKPGASGGPDIKGLNEATNLSVGKMVQVNVEDDGKKATFPISVRLIATPIRGDVLTHILGDGSRNISAKERFHAWRSGQIEFVRDLIFCQDLIDEHRKALMKDDSGAYAEILARRATNASAGVMSGTPSIGTASNLVVMTTQTAKELEHSIGGRLSDVNTRNKVFKNTYVMIMVVVDPEWEQVTIYHRGIALPTKLSVKELKTANKGTGPDIGDILKAYQLGQNPSI